MRHCDWEYSCIALLITWLLWLHKFQNATLATQSNVTIRHISDSGVVFHNHIVRRRLVSSHSSCGLGRDAVFVQAIIYRCLLIGIILPY